MEDGYEKATSSNLPIVDMDMILDYLKDRKDFNSAEIKNVKSDKSARVEYGDKAIGHVQLKRDGDFCYVVSKITPEHKVHKKAYNVKVAVNEKDASISCSECFDCSASQGGCKHGIAMVFWLHRRTLDSSVTSEVCYWKASTLSKVGTTMKAATLKYLCNDPSCRPIHVDPTFLQEFVRIGREEGCQGMLFLPVPNDILCSTSLHRLRVRHKYDSSVVTLESYVQHVENNLSSEACKRVEEQTREQSKSHIWKEVRYGRITASIAYEASCCTTPDGSLVERIFGGGGFFETSAVIRGRRLEPLVLETVSKIRNIKINKCGIFISKEYPMFGASPDGITADYCIEVKCPSNDNTVRNYIDNDVIKKKPYTQLQIQMFLSKRRKGLLCVASPKFEETGEVRIIDVNLDVSYCDSIINKCKTFWEMNIFPKL